MIDRFGQGGVGLRRSVRIFTAALVAGAVVLSVAAPARAEIRGPCQATLAGRDVTTADTRRTAVRVNVDDTVPYSGQTTDGSEVSFVDVTLELAGFDLRLVEGHPTSGSTWSSEAEVGKYAWAGVGLYLVRGDAFAADRSVICTGRAYVCVQGRSPFTTVAGAVAIALIVLGALILLFALLRRGGRSRGGLARRLGFGGLLAGLGAPILLQQACLAALTPVVAFGIPLAALVLMILLGLLLGGGGVAPPVTPPAPQPPREDEPTTSTVYRFAPGAGTCRACQGHAAHRVYATAEAAAADRAHPGCDCQIAPQQVPQATATAYFGRGSTVYDDRTG